MSDDHRAGRLLVVDDSFDARELLERNLTARGYQVLTAASVPEALSLLESTRVDLVITDLKMPGMSGIDLVRQVKTMLKGTQVVVITGYPSVEGAVTAVKLGAEGFLTKPFTQDELLATVSRVMRKAAEQSPHDRPVGRQVPNPLGLVAESAGMRAVLDAAAQAAGSATPVLIVGERGTGRGLVARTIHFAGPRAESPFVSVACGAIPAELVDRQLFGTAAEIATGAAGLPSAGLVHAANGGTLFLRDVDRLPPHSQAKLLHVLGAAASRPAGPTRDHAADVRPIAASDDRLSRPAEGTGRAEDLFDRLGSAVITVPPLRERREDLPVLARYFLARFAADSATRVPPLSAEALDIIVGYAWPGNVPELQNCMRRLAVAAAGGAVEVTDLPEPMRSRARRSTDLERSLADLEADHIRSVLAAAKGNKTRAAEILGINRKTLREKLKHRGRTPA